MKVIETVAELKQWRSTLPSNLKVGFVPTMGALHAGHTSLITRAKLENDLVVLSIFVNPTQFNNPRDLETYPRTLESDFELARLSGVDILFRPCDSSEIYPEGYSRYQVVETDFSKVLCGAHRPGHFEGVLTVVMKLLNLVRPTRAYFGEKDYQQLSLIEGMARVFFLDTEIVGCPTQREADGLALSSRNLLLQPEHRKIAPRLFHAMTEIADLEEARKVLESEGFKVDYLEERQAPNGRTRRFAAAYLGGVRLIDNVAVYNPRPEE